MCILTHLRSSENNMCERRAKYLMKPSQHIDRMMHTISNEEVEKHRLFLKTSIRSARWLAFQSCSFKGHNESSSSLNHRNFIEMIKFLAEKNTEIDNLVLKNAPKNAQYIAPSIQKEILHIMVNRVRKMICEEIMDTFVFLLIKHKMHLKREQMTIILRFVNDQGILTDCYFDIKSVGDTTSSSLKNEIVNVLAQHELEVAKMRGQGYDDANNMRGAWNGLQALFLKDYLFAYYVHCFARRLQLVLVYAAKEVDVIWEFFSHLDNIINIITSFPKRIMELQFVQRNEIEHMLATGERELGSGVNQVGNLQQSGATCWSSHYDSRKSLIDMYNATCKVFESLSVHCPTGRSRGKVRGTSKHMKSFDFVFSFI
ncbi:zinc finger MYM-type protein 1-like [Olea europaea var. sylvestris]|uniref:zinc finger MYM-type protein 1-like n=1 Tax=Olea europaea var. sylvestris TaxID=158386 RepID=UPI000C1D57FB|nr:zinc finger MYM-type protein 1-like [Olea europaea var. sylvestris]